MINLEEWLLQFLPMQAQLKYQRLNRSKKTALVFTGVVAVSVIAYSVVIYLNP